MSATAARIASYALGSAASTRHSTVSRVAAATDAWRRYATSNNRRDRQEALASGVIVVYRTDADLRGVDLSMDPNDRPYGSLFGSRPDLTNYGVLGFGRLTTPEAWLSTWSGLSSRAGLLRCAPSVRVPSLLVELTGDQTCSRRTQAPARTRSPAMTSPTYRWRVSTLVLPSRRVRR
jgi:hypothetical protein